MPNRDTVRLRHHEAVARESKMRNVFNVKANRMTDGSATVYSIDTPEGERIASTTVEHSAMELAGRLNTVLDDWQGRYGFDAVVA